MENRWHSVFGSASWPSKRGNPFNRNISPVKATGRGEPLWSISLPERRANGIAVAEDGCCFVNLDNQLLAVEPGGKIRWTTQSMYALSSPVVLADGRLIIYEEGVIATRDQATGRILATLPSRYATVPAITPEENLVYSGTPNEKDPAQLHMTTPTGEILWTLPIEHNPYRPPLILDDLIVVADKSYMRAFNFKGELQWIADQEGFIVASPETRMELLTKVNPIKQGWEDRVVSPIIWLGEGRLLAGIEWSAGSGYYIFDLHEHSVHPLDVHLPLKEPLAVPVVPEHGPCLVTRGFSAKGKMDEQPSAIAMVDLNGQLIWQQPLPIRPSGIIGDADARIFLACSPSFDRWDKYRVWYKLEEECFVRGLSPEGQELFTWYAPGPISPPMAIGKQGELYVIAEGKLWAIG